MAVMQVINGPNSGRQYTLGNGTTVLGRHPDCDIMLEVAAVSRQHARILRDGASFVLEDLGSRNGTYINGRKIKGRKKLSEGDRVRICDLDFDFYLNPPSDMLAGPMPSGEEPSMALLLDDARDDVPSTSTVMSTFEISSTRSGAYLSARPEVKLQAMVEIAQSLGRAVSVDDVLPKLLASLFKVFVQADRGFIILRSEAGALVPKAVKYRRSEDDHSARISRTIVNQAMETGEAILSADAATDERFNLAQSVADFHIRSMMCAPLIDTDGRALGVIQIDTLDQRSRFNPDDLEVLASVASQAAVAIENAQLHEQTLVQQAIQRDLELARTVQKGLLPQAAPEVAGYHFFDYYEPANQVGGDYYDYVLLPGGRVAVVLGDVAGKGVAAALLMAKLAGDVRYCLASVDNLAGAVCQVNRTFVRSGWDDRFVTFVVAVVDPATHELEVINAGHMPPILRQDSGQVEAIGEEETGLPLGVDKDFEYEVYRRKLAPGETVTLFTDGISEAMNADKELYGLERLREQLAVEAVGVADLGKHLLEDVRRFVGGRPQSDDMCVAFFGRVAE